jgi:hypothetical protein
MSRPLVFIGSSKEGKEVAQKIRTQLKEDAEVTIWDEGPFGLSKGTLEELVRALSTFDFAILVLTPDDMIESREQSSQAPRDNVLFECGLFMGHLGRSRTFIVYDIDSPVKIPSDLAGVKFATYRGNRKDGNLLAAVGEAADEIRDIIKAFTKPSVPDRTLQTEYQFGQNHYQEDLQLWIHANRSISGVRNLLEDSGKQTSFAVKGYSGDGYYYLEYHREDGSGGGAILLRHISAGRQLGLLIAPNWETGVLRCYTNKWLPRGDTAAYDPRWLEKIGEVDEQGIVSRDAGDLERAGAHIANYMDHHKFSMVSFERIRKSINSNYSDEFLMKIIDRYPNRFRRTTLKGDRPGVGKF